MDRQQSHYIKVIFVVVVVIKEEYGLKKFVEKGFIIALFNGL